MCIPTLTFHEPEEWKEGREKPETGLIFLSHLFLRNTFHRDQENEVALEFSIETLSI